MKIRLRFFDAARRDGKRAVAMPYGTREEFDELHRKVLAAEEHAKTTRSGYLLEEAKKLRREYQRLAFFWEDGTHRATHSERLHRLNQANRKFWGTQQ